MRKRSPAAVLSLAIASIALLVASSGHSLAAGPADWPAYLYGPAHSSLNAVTTAITPANADSLHPAWPKAKVGDKGPPGAPIPTWLASPIVVNGRVYIGNNTGDFYAYDLATGQREWKTPLGFQPTLTCSGEGIVSTATAAVDRDSGKLRIYTAAGDGYLYALNSADGAIVWRTKIAPVGTQQNTFFPWASPTVINGRIYIGVSSNCDNPLIRGGLRAYDQSTGSLLAIYNTVPSGSVGGSIWTSAAANARGANILVSTGNADPNGTENGDSYSIVRLNGTTLAKTDIWTVPNSQLGNDSDFGASPTIFRAKIGGQNTPLVGACNKNGKYYAMKLRDLSSGPLWTDQINDPHMPGGQAGLCLSAAVWDGTHLFESGSGTTIDGTNYKGSIREINPVNGAYLWETGFPASIFGSPSLGGGGVLAVPTYDFLEENSVYLVDAANGDILGRVSVGASQIFSQPAFAGRYLVVASRTAGLMAYTP